MDRIASAARGLRHVFLRDMVLLASIGVLQREQSRPQRIRINLDLGVEDHQTGEGPDKLSRVVDYGRVAASVRDIVGAGHVRLVETLAERIALACLADERVLLARVRVEKLDVFDDALSAGVEIERCRGDFSTR
jgi:dihydroneopterin aldolase